MSTFSPIREASAPRDPHEPFVQVPASALIHFLEYSTEGEVDHFCEMFDVESPSPNDTYQQWLEVVEKNPRYRAHILYNILELYAALEKAGIIVKYGG